MGLFFVALFVGILYNKKQATEEPGRPFINRLIMLEREVASMKKKTKKKLQRDTRAIVIGVITGLIV